MTEKIRCTCCGKEKSVTQFYKSKSCLYKSIGRLPICKECIGDIYNNYFAKFNDERLAIYYLCRKLDISFSQSCFNAVISNRGSQKDSLAWKIYMQKFNSLGGQNGYGNTFDDSDEIDIKKEVEKNEIKNVDDETLNFWGKGFEEEDYNFLNNEYNNMLSRYECDSYAQEVLFQDIAFQRLDIRKKRQRGDNVDKELKTLQDLLGSANIKPAQENASVNSEQVTFGTLIKKYENEKPIPEPEKEWISKDWIRKYVTVWFFGNLCRMMGKDNPYKEEYDEEIGKYTVHSQEDGESDE